MEEARELLVQCQHRHSHTNRTLDSLNNVDRPPRVAPAHRLWCTRGCPVRRSGHSLSAMACFNKVAKVGLECKASPPQDPPCIDVLMPLHCSKALGMMGP